MARKGFYSSAFLDSQEKPQFTSVSKCGACGFSKKCKSPKLSVYGEGGRGILIVDEFPSMEEDQSGRFGTSMFERFLSNTMETFGVSLEKDCWLTKALICKPTSKVTDEHIKYCRPNIQKLIEELKPKVIILLGYYAVKSVIPLSWGKESIGTGSGSNKFDDFLRWEGYQIPSQKWNCWICPVRSPERVLSVAQQRGSNPVPMAMFRKFLRAALHLDSRPWEEVPDYEKEIICITDTKRALREIEWIIKHPAPCAFDYETNMLKPDSEKGFIMSNSICWKGKKTIAYLWNSETSQATKRFLLARHPKIASNMKFEDRWTAAKLGIRVRNWAWDTMLAAHTISNRAGVTSIKFQSYVLLGQACYNEHIEPYLKSKKTGCYEENRIKEIPIDKLLLYDGMDSLLEYKVARIQMKFFQK